jgi:glycosyltransferase involved in cell wall biosynthesis
MNSPLLSVCLITYNHANYIRDAIEGVLMQQASFPWELIIADDFSTDGTREIVEEYGARHPGLIRLILQETNVGAARNWMDLITAVTSKYLAYCEGDDYWTDPRKLQKQVDFLEANQSNGLCYTAARQYNAIKGKYDRGSFGRAFRNRDEILLRNLIPSLTIVARTDLYHRYLNEVRPQTRDWEMGDYPGWLWFAFNSRIHCMEDITGTYRVAANGASHTLNRGKRFHFNVSAFRVADYFARKHCTEREYERFLEKRYLWLYLTALKGNIPGGREYATRLQSLRHLGWKARLSVLLFHQLGLSQVFSRVFGTMSRNGYARNAAKGLR